MLDAFGAVLIAIGLSIIGLSGILWVMVHCELEEFVQELSVLDLRGLIELIEQDDCCK
jgi:hypothetical protein